LQFLPYPREDTLQVSQHLVIPEAQHADALRLQRRATLGITSPAFVTGVLASIQFDRQLRRAAIEVQHEALQRVLLAELETAQLMAAQAAPEQVLRICHLAAQSPGGQQQGRRHGRGAPGCGFSAAVALGQGGKM
jgi:hypothetical protein